MKLNSLYIYSTCLAVRLPSQREEMTTNIPMTTAQDTTVNIDETIISEVSTHGTTSKNVIIDEVISMEKQSRIIGGEKVRSADLFPSFVSIRKNGWHTCGGVILDEYRVLTAQHCNITEDHIVFAGGIDYDGSDIEQKVRILNVTNHPNYKFPENDISVVQLDKKLCFSSRVQPIEFGSEEEFEKVKNGNGTCQIVGHGKIDSRSSVATQLQTARQAYMSNRTCRHYMVDQQKEVPVLHGAVLYDDNSENCFLTRDNDAGSQGCNGDSGGPLYCKIGDGMKLFGIASFVGNETVDARSGWKPCSDGWTGWMLPTKYSSFINSTVVNETAYPETICKSSSLKAGLFFILALVTLFL